MKGWSIKFVTADLDAQPKLILAELDAAVVRVEAYVSQLSDTVKAAGNSDVFVRCIDNLPLIWNANTIDKHT